MDKFNTKKVLSDEKGISLVVLILTIVVMFILAAISIQTGSESLDNTRLQGFYTQLEIIQKRVDDIAATNENYKDSNGNIVYLKDKGTQVTQTEQIEFLKTILIGLTDDNAKKFRYFTIEELENDLDLIEMEYNVYIDFDNRIIIAEEGVVKDGVRYNMLENTTYFVEKDKTDKNKGNIQLEYTVTQYGDKYKVIAKPINYNIGDLAENGYVKYKTTNTKYWKISDNTEMIVELDVEYNIQYIDSNNNSIEEKIKVELQLDDEDNNVPIVIKIGE